MSPHVARPFDLGSCFTAQQALEQGISLKALQHRVGTGELVRLRRGVYAMRAELDPRAIIEAALLTAPANSIVSHDAAACLHEVPLPHGRPLGRVDLYVASGTPAGGGRPAPEVRLHYVELAESQVTRVDGIDATSLARTAIDVSCGHPLERAVIAIDHVRGRGVSKRELIEARNCARGRRGVATVDHAISQSSALAESPLESMSRVIFEVRGLPCPELQVWLTGASGRRFRVDFYWRDQQLIGEADGLAKYGGVSEALHAEKAREDDLRLAGFGVVRWTWNEMVRTPDLVAARVATSLKRRRLL